MTDVEAFAIKRTKPDHRDFIRNAYEKWNEWNKDLFDGFFDDNDKPLIILKPMLTREVVEGGGSAANDDRGTIALFDLVALDELGCVQKSMAGDGMELRSRDDPYDGKRPIYLLCENTWTGVNGILVGADKNPEGCFLFMMDKMLHEMVHHCIRKQYGSEELDANTTEEDKLEVETDDRERVCKGSDWWEMRRFHTKFFALACNQICERLGLPGVRYYYSNKDHEENPCRSCVWFITNLRPWQYYEGAVLDHRVFHRPETCSEILRPGCQRCRMDVEW